MKILNCFYKIFNPHYSIKFKYSSHCSKETLCIEPIKCLQDESVKITIKNLSPETKITLTSSVQDTRGHNFFTYAHYIVDTSGNVNISKDASVGGTYKGIFPMGPIACLQPGPQEHKYLRFSKRDVATPLMVNFKLLHGHLDAMKSFSPESHEILDSIAHERIYMTPQTERIDVRSGRLRGTLFLPEGEGPFPGVVDLFGTSGGLVEFRSAQFAARGIASLALAYFDFEDLPKGLEQFDIGYFEEAVYFLLNNSKVKKSGVGALGVSKGGDLVCSMGTYIPEVKAVVCVSGLPINTMCPLRIKNKIIPGLHFNFSRVKILNSELVSSYDMMDESADFPETFIPMHESDAEFLFIVGKDDKNWKTELETMNAVGRIKAHGKSNFEVVSYEGTGHLIEPPYSPFAYATYHKLAGSGLQWGGFPFEHSAAQVDSWNRILSFFKKNL